MQIIHQFEQDKVEAIIAHLVGLPLHNDPSTYSKGRQILWLGSEPLLYVRGNCKKNSKSAYKSSYIQGLCSLLFDFTVDYILITYSGDDGCGINWHRDATYANPLSGTINLGKARFGSRLNNGLEETWLDLTGGEVITFNSKYLHTAIVQPNRWAIHCWKDSGR